MHKKNFHQKYRNKKKRCLNICVLNCNVSSLNPASADIICVIELTLHGLQKVHDKPYVGDSRKLIPTFSIFIRTVQILWTNDLRLKMWPRWKNILLPNTTIYFVISSVRCGGKKYFEIFTRQQAFFYFFLAGDV